MPVNKYLTFEFWTDETSKNRVRALAIFLSEAFRVCMACELYLFVPQRCVLANDDVGRLCTLSELIYSHRVEDVLMLSLNTTTLGLTVVLYVFEMMRDLWLMEHFSFNAAVSETNIERFRSSQRTLFMRMELYNWCYLWSYKFVIALYTVNFVVSAYFIGHNEFYGVQTVTAILSYGLSYFLKLFSGWLVASKAVRLNIPLSYYSVKHLAYNEIEGTYKINVLTERPSKSRLQSIIDLTTSHMTVSETEILQRRTSRILHQENEFRLSRLSTVRPPDVPSPVTRTMTLFPFLRQSTKAGDDNTPSASPLAQLHPLDDDPHLQEWSSANEEGEHERRHSVDPIPHPTPETLP